MSTGRNLWQTRTCVLEPIRWTAESLVPNLSCRHPTRLLLIQTCTRGSGSTQKRLGALSAPLLVPHRTVWLRDHTGCAQSLRVRASPIASPQIDLTKCSEQHRSPWSANETKICHLFYLFRTFFQTFFIPFSRRGEAETGMHGPEGLKHTRRPARMGTTTASGLACHFAH